MKRRILLVVVVMMMALSPCAFASPVLNSANGHYYDIVSFAPEGGYLYNVMDTNHVVNDLNVWSYANGYAAATSYMGLGGHLATITTNAEDMFVLDMIRARNAGDSFVGGYKKADGSWAWVTGEQWSYTRWGAGEPNNFIAPWTDLTGEQYLRVRMINDGWNDDRGVSGNYVVEYENQEPAPTPIPGAVWLLGSGLVGMMGFKRTRKV